MQQHPTNSRDGGDEGGPPATGTSLLSPWSNNHAASATAALFPVVTSSPYRSNSKPRLSTALPVPPPPRSPRKSPLRLKRSTVPSNNTMLPSSTRLYRAPQPSMRSSSSNNDAEIDGSRSRNLGMSSIPTSSNTRRRRPCTTTSHALPLTPNLMDDDGNRHNVLQRQNSDSSLPIDAMLYSPPLWNSSNEEEDLHHSVPEIAWQRTPPPSQSRQPQTPLRGSLHVRKGHAYHDPYHYDASDRLDDDSFAEHHHHYHAAKEHQHRYRPPHRRFIRCGGPTATTTTSRPGLFLQVLTASNIGQILVLLLLAGIIYDGHHKVHRHKIQIQAYDEERTHILEQMMWIDKAAKKVHKKYSENNMVLPLQDESQVELQRDVQEARDELQQVQLRIQLNARDFMAERFGSQPMQVTLRVSDAYHVTMALSDDAPHAVWTFIQQVDRGLWNNVLYRTDETVVGVIQASAQQPTTTPLLEFVEKSHKCREAGAVAIRQLQDEEHPGLHVLVLRINTGLQVITASSDDDSVCIGKVLSGLDSLAKVTSAIMDSAAHDDIVKVGA